MWKRGLRDFADAQKGLWNHFAAKGWFRSAAKRAFSLRCSASNVSQISGNFRRNSTALCKMAAKSFRSKRVISQPYKILPSAWSDWFLMAITPSFQLQIAHCLKNWIVDFPSFKTTYSMHKLNSRKCSKSDWHQECFMANFSLLPLLELLICLWKRTSKLWFFMFMSFPLLCHRFQITLLNLGLLWW